MLPAVAVSVTVLPAAAIVPNVPPKTMLPLAVVSVVLTGDVTAKFTLMAPMSCCSVSVPVRLVSALVTPKSPTTVMPPSLVALPIMMPPEVVMLSSSVSSSPSVVLSSVAVAPTWIPWASSLGCSVTSPVPAVMAPWRSILSAVNVTAAPPPVLVTTSEPDAMVICLLLALAMSVTAPLLVVTSAAATTRLSDVSSMITAPVPALVPLTVSPPVLVTSTLFAVLVKVRIDTVVSMASPPAIPTAAVRSAVPVVEMLLRPALPSVIAPAVASSVTVPPPEAVTSPRVRLPVSAISSTVLAASTAVAMIPAVERTAMSPLNVSKSVSVSPPMSLMKMPPALTVICATRSPTLISSGPVPVAPAPPVTPIAPWAFSVSVPVVVMSVVSLAAASRIVLAVVNVRLRSASVGSTVPTKIAPAVALPTTSVPAVTKSISLSSRLKVCVLSPKPMVVAATDGCRVTVPTPAFSVPTLFTSIAVIVIAPPPAAVLNDAPAALA